MSGDVALFGDEEPQVAAAVPSAPTPVADWQVDLLRKALDARGLSTMAERQQAVATVVGRSVESLRGLTHDEAMIALTRWGRARAPDVHAKSSWDDRGEDTWIDRL